MDLENDINEFENLCLLTSQHFNISKNNIKRDYYLVKILLNLNKSEYLDKVVFKGGTSLSKCYKNTIKRFSEDIDLTFIPNKGFNNKKYDKNLKNIEKIIAKGFLIEKINNERNDRNKSSWVWQQNEIKEKIKIKLEIGSSIYPYPYKKRKIKTYIQEYLENNNLYDVIKKYSLVEFEINVLCIERTFLDKVMAVKRHALCGTLNKKTRHIYDVVNLFKCKQIQKLLNNKKGLKEILIKTKQTDSFYLLKRNINKEYNPLLKFDFNSWRNLLNKEIEKNYYKLDEIVFDKITIINFKDVIKTFESINESFNKINE